MEKISAQDAFLRYKTAETYDAYGNPVSQTSSPIIPMLLGGGLGGAAAHMIPTEEAQGFRTQMEQITPEMAEKSQKQFKARQLLKSKALQANARRLLAGLGMGALGGYLTHKYLE